MRTLLEHELERPGSARGFLTGAVTVCELVPMRTIPFRVVCLLGLNDGTFPRARRPLGFDHMAAQPQPGDRTARDDDRYLFLEALLAARQHLIVTYVGQSVSDNAALPPSVVVNELLDAIDATCTDAAGRPRQRIVQRHALQPFSPHYFGRDPQGRAFSYASTHYAGAAALVGPRQATPPVLAAPLPAVPIAAVALEDVVRFFDHPSRWFLQQRLGIYLGRDAELLDEREPIELDHLELWRIGDALLRPRHASGAAVDDAWALRDARAGARRSALPDAAPSMTAPRRPGASGRRSGEERLRGERAAWWRSISVQRARRVRRLRDRLAGRAGLQCSTQARRPP
jgi:exodeoxyribonuclease V gamma subunit